MTQTNRAALIDALDDDGYLASTLEEIADMFSEHDALEPEELMIGLKYLQSFEPAGVGARNPAECLSLQLKLLPATTPEAGHQVFVDVVPTSGGTWRLTVRLLICTLSSPDRFRLWSSANYSVCPMTTGTPSGYGSMRQRSTPTRSSRDRA
jgi:hypothetical protein